MTTLWSRLGHIISSTLHIPEDFEMCFKVWEEITIPTYACSVWREGRITESSLSRCEAVQ